ncbi:sugar transferase [Finegoldia magna]|uniref:sugar transferase n=1 Tax=Finegoldia magna TaxID=1260 RepID=UPI0029039AC5|nr:sugar transferase [Finegoldia magna]MDU2218971.1 sugar transferase [Finegoldia magna]
MNFFKRILGLIFSLVGFIILIPIFLIISILIKLTSKGSIFFKQERIGRNGKVFNMYKFRTMIVNAENIGDGIRVRSKNDPRITKIGKILRRTSLDELPQLINVIKGDMSLVGPRPPVTYHPYNGYNNYPENAKKRFIVRPGLTGLSQIKYRNGVSWDKRIEIDVKYTENISFLEDIKIILATIKIVFKPVNIELKEK